MQWTAPFLAGTPGVHEVNLLTYHSYGIDRHELIDGVHQLSGELRADHSVLQKYCRTIEMAASHITCGTGRSETGG